MSAELISTLIDIAIGASVLGGTAAVVTFRKRIARWWRLFSGAGQAIERIETQLQEFRAHLVLIESAQRLSLDANEHVATFETDAEGRNVLVNSTYARWVGVSKQDLLGWRFLNYVHPDDQDRVRDELALARAEARPYRIPHRMVTAEGEVIRVEKNGSPIPDPGVPVKWIGSVRRLRDDP